ncbi:transposase, Ptta/En/Spm [Artemisia annua]|uniref:Transposase, Ptta/En/Spm n=1 Tax=Artemisia annua TaxID=35608 RepID=A0A2U1LP13_ARTAN|nr:transposase, Ptta/En/Spm [Artemisia annua]
MEKIVVFDKECRIACTYSYAPLIYNSWHKVPNKDRISAYVLEKYNVPGDAKPLVLKTIGACWRGHKSLLKKKHFYDLKDNNTRLKNHPKCTANVSKKNMHTTGPKSFARICEDIKNEDPNKEPPSLTKLIKRTRKRKEGHEQMKNYQAPEENGSGQDKVNGDETSYMVSTELIKYVKIDIDAEMKWLVEIQKQIEDALVNV